MRRIVVPPDGENRPSRDAASRPNQGAAAGGAPSVSRQPTQAHPSQQSTGSPARNQSAPPPWKAQTGTPQKAATGEALRAAYTQDQIDAANAKTQHYLRSAQARLDGLNAAAGSIKTADLLAADNEVTGARNKLPSLQEAAARTAKAEHVSKSEQLRTNQRALIESLAPGAASRPWDGDWSSVANQPLLTEFIAAGVLDIGEESYPALVPFSSQCGLYLTGDGLLASRLALEAVCRTIAQVSERNLNIHVFDPGLTATFGKLSPLRQLRADLFPVPASQVTAFRKELEEILTDAASCAEKVISQGADSLAALWREDPLADATLDLIVVLDYPYAIDGTTHDLLMRLSRAGGASGVQLIIQESATASASRDVDPQELKALHQAIECRRDALVIDGYAPSVPVSPARGFDDETVVRIVTARTESAKNAELPTIRLEDLIEEDISAPWTKTSADSLDIVVGRVGKSGVMRFQIRSESPPNTNLLIGGAVGQGKSNLLLDVIYSLTCAYGPDELELLLLDFKQGIEFKRFDKDGQGKNWLPHAKVLCLESNQAFGLAVLRYVEKELQRRAVLFKGVELPGGQKGVSSLAAYRAATGKALPRVVLVIDEFHRLFEGERDGVDEAVDLIENLSKQGRASGVHLILASQTISGITAMGTRKDGIFAQFPLRMSLKNSPAESQAILSTGNKAAAELSFRGELVLNQNMGNDPANSNERGLAAYVDPETFAGVQAKLWERGHGEAPMIFLGASFSPFPAKRLAAHENKATKDAALEMWLGQRIEISDVPASIRLSKDADQGVAIIGPDDEAMPVVPHVLRSMFASSAAWLRANKARVIVLNGEGSTPSGWLGELIGTVKQGGVTVDFIGREAVRDYLLTDIRQLLAEPTGETIVVLALGLQRIANLDEELKDGEGFSALRYSARSVLQDLASKGAIDSIFFIGWWLNLQAVQTEMAMKRTAISTYITAKAGLEDLKSLAGARVGKIDGHPRIGVYDKNGGGNLLQVIPYGMDGDDAC